MIRTIGETEIRTLVVKTNKGRRYNFATCYQAKLQANVNGKWRVWMNCGANFLTREGATKASIQMLETAKF